MEQVTVEMCLLLSEILVLVTEDGYNVRFSRVWIRISDLRVLQWEKDH